MHAAVCAPAPVASCSPIARYRDRPRDAHKINDALGQALLAKVLRTQVRTTWPRA